MNSNPTGLTKPKQKISYAEKGKKWADETAEYYLKTCIDAVDYADAMKNYRLANGQLDEHDYLYVTNPFGTTRPELTGFPARLMNYDIITPNISLLMGEKARRQFPPIVYARNSNHHIQMMEEEKKMLIRELQKRFVNEVAAMGVPLEEEQITMELEQIQARIKKLPDELAALGQDTLEHIMDLNQLPRHFRRGFYDWIAQACVYSYKDVYKNKTCYESVSPLNIGYLCSEHHEFIQYGEAVRCKHRMSINEVYDRFQDAKGFKGEIEDWINSQSAVSSSTGSVNYGYSVGATDVMAALDEMVHNVFGGSTKEDYSRGVDVVHVMWRSQTKVGTLRRYDIFGNELVDIVDDSFKPVEGDDIEWEWKDEIWENYKIGDKYWLAAQVVPIQNNEKPMLLYNGRNMVSRHTRPIPLVRKGEKFQKDINIIKYRAENTLAKNMDKVILFPLGLIPNKEGWDEEKLLYYIRSFGILFFDDTRSNASAMVQAMKDLDLSSMQYIIQAYQICELIKREWDQLCGFTPQRKGEGITASSAVGATQSAQERSYVMSEEMFLEYEEFEREEYEGMLEISKFAFSEGLQAHFVRQDGTAAFLDLHDPSSFLYAQLGVFVKNGTREYQKLELLRQQVQAFAQNQVDPGMIAAIIEGENFAKLHKIMDDIEAKMEMRRQQDLAIQQEATASAERIANEQKEFNYYSEDLKSYTDIQVALIQAGMQLADQLKGAEEKGTTNTPDYATMRDNLEKNQIALMQNATKIKEIASKEKMNKLDNKTALANKVAGEK